MQEGLIDFIQQPRHNGLMATDQPLHFILDQALYPGLVQELAAQHVYAFDFLLIGTDFTSRATNGPIWLSAEPQSDLAQWCMQLCQHHHAGIVIAASDREQALAHARWLLKVNDGTGGQSWMTYYQPALCAALLGTTDASSMPLLLGPWSALYAPSPRHIHGLEPGWLSWQTEHPGQTPTHALLSLPPRTQPTYITLRWVYWLDQEHAAFNSPDVKQLPALIDNLNLMLEHQLTKHRHLLQLAKLITHPSLASEPAVMAILRSTDSAFAKVEQLLALPDSRSN
ncbi:DUF4123 domain-containing protein [Pseudomonas sp. H9]|uniref:DUF4123 domain-containing protein n=1 Tax=Pseudomonas sp. H9 TaxID=483968 RepID=UPI00105835AF|nr:DUF4123 domain-containing protein [Pseudomonas sp. H9]TDF84067.1 DUF4123 domain-containing protein [Pseudomonas sp. H9]